MTWVPDACTLPTADQPLRVAEFASLFAASLRAVTRPAPDRLDLVLDGSALDGTAEAHVRDLVARESGCCSFFVFDVRVVDGRVEVGVGVPPAQVGVLDGLEAQARGVLRP